MGVAANARTRELRRRVHRMLDASWRNANGKQRGKRRDAAYRKLARVMGMTEEQAHVGLFDEEQCLRALSLLGQEQK